MNLPFIADKNFSQSDLPIELAEYEECTFKDCSFADYDLSNFKFCECRFINCDLSNAKLSNTSFSDTKFEGCKLIGLHFEDCSDFLFSPEFSDCNLNYSSFFKKTIKKARVINCSLLETDFTEANFPDSRFDNCNLDGAVFLNTNLEKADLGSSVNIQLDPEQNRISKAKFSLHVLPGLLQKYNINVVD